MTKRSGRSRKSTRRSSTDPSATTGAPQNGNGGTTTGSAESRLRAEAERRADQALAEIADADDKADEDRRILRGNGVSVHPGDADCGDAVTDVPQPEESTESPDALSSEFPGPNDGHEGEEASARSASVEPMPAPEPDPGTPARSREPAPGPATDVQPDLVDPSANDEATITTPDRDNEQAVSARAETPVEEVSDGTLSSGTGATQKLSEAPDSDVPGSTGNTVPDYLRTPRGSEYHSPSRGRVKISEKTVTKIVRQAAASVPGTTGQAGGLDVLGRNYPRFDVELDRNADAVAIDAYIAVSWPSPVTRVAETVRTTIFDWVRDMTNIPVVRVNVTVGPIVPGADRVTEAELSAFDTTPRLRSVVVTATNAALNEITCSSRGSELKPVSVTSGSDTLRPVTVSGPDNAALREISTGVPEDLRPITVSEPGELHTVSVTGKAAAQVFSPQVSASAPLQEISVADPRPLADITVSESQPLADITVPDPAPLKPVTARELPSVAVSVPEAPQPRSVMVPHPQALRKVETPEPTRLVSVHAPDSHRLAQIHAETLRVSSIREPRPVRLTPVKRNPIGVTRKPRVDARPVSEGRPVSRRRVNVTPTELRPITIKPSTIVPVRVDPANVKAVFRDE
ncbi:Asp23/Gls24 family envelope stress response protein [Corynebacterium sp. CCM 9185]|uniref:Asp23/Gls24 family envelope stress response protein n=1 Tax=Corynebacterium marambiense TaxID=2765364 RepID=A0ABS0VRW1_9CORY|nr:Asp23/Gls24 family envelope stress response protein [Corynebacterium marambiense]MBI8999504.1 Asp23/Gls24 family envelope stress response protein [Corynebacterium marambiense]MCK7662342.1 Asp23/Gls24 family envelope stress response protein [Corynebacterium marambiense]